MQGEYFSNMIANSGISWVPERCGPRKNGPFEDGESVLSNCFKRIYLQNTINRMLIERARALPQTHPGILEFIQEIWSFCFRHTVRIFGEKNCARSGK
jgi:hypothetical protein